VICPLPFIGEGPVGPTINNEGLIVQKRKKGNNLVKGEKNNNGNRWQ